eukprot:PhM_4_TR210/c0_g1_i1/m.74893
MNSNNNNSFRGSILAPLPTTATTQSKLRHSNIKTVRTSSITPAPTSPLLPESVSLRATDLKVSRHEPSPGIVRPVATHAADVIKVHHHSLLHHRHSHLSTRGPLQGGRLPPLDAPAISTTRSDYLRPSLVSKCIS